jgi:tRNA(fMet)-specific endonuclease VapC
VTYLLDTNACIAIINGEPRGVRRRPRSVLTRGESVTVSSIALFEHWYGVAESARTAAADTERLAVFLARWDAALR